MSEISATSTASEATQVKLSPSEQARIRKERREAKIRAGGNVRLNKITGLGGVQRGKPLFGILHLEAVTLTLTKILYHNLYLALTQKVRSQIITMWRQDPAFHPTKKILRQLKLLNIKKTP